MLLRLCLDLWYLVRPPWDTGASAPELLSYIETHGTERAVDLGCRTGTNVLTLAKRGWQVVGVDYSPRAIQLARHKLLGERIDAMLLITDVSKNRDQIGPFDLVLDIGCFHTFRNRAEDLANLGNLLRTAGHWLMYGLLRSVGARSGPGIDQLDLDLGTDQGLRLVERKDGVDRQARPSAWFLLGRMRLPA